jgi:hypothetical protein
MESKEHLPSTQNAATAVIAAEQQRAIAEVQAAMMLARANPRDERRALDRILMACARPSLAERAVYEYARGGTDISGPSIRLAEAIAQAWGNLQYGVRELSRDHENATVQAYAWDLETGTRREVTFQVPLIRSTKKGSYRLEDPRDIYETVANQGARRVRACILALIPGDIVDAAVEQCELTMKAKADVSPEAVARMVEAFGELGVTREQIELRIQRRIDSITPAQIVQLKKIYASLRDGMSNVSDWFESSGNGEAHAAPQQQPSLADKIRKRRKEESEAAPQQKQNEEPQPHAQVVTAGSDALRARRVEEEKDI